MPPQSIFEYVPFTEAAPTTDSPRFDMSRRRHSPHRPWLDNCPLCRASRLSPTLQHMQTIRPFSSTSAHSHPRPDSSTARQRQHPCSPVVARAQGYRFRWLVTPCAARMYGNDFASTTPLRSCCAYQPLHIRFCNCPQLLSSPRVFEHATLELRRAVLHPLPPSCPFSARSTATRTYLGSLRHATRHRRR
jgi:hypothetical protein